jgi:hypothetical protein
MSTASRALGVSAGGGPPAREPLVRHREASRATHPPASNQRPAGGAGLHAPSARHGAAAATAYSPAAWAAEPGSCGGSGGGAGSAAVASAARARCQRSFKFGVRSEGGDAAEDWQVTITARWAPRRALPCCLPGYACCLCLSWRPGKAGRHAVASPGYLAAPGEARGKPGGQ